MPPTYTLTPSKPAMALDLVNHLVAAMLDVSNAAIFYPGFDKAANLNQVALYTGVILPAPNDAGFMLAEETANLGTAPQTTYDCQLTLRAKSRAAAPPVAAQTGQARVDAIAKAVTLYLRPNGENRNQVTLPSGRRVMGFMDVTTAPVGQDTQERYVVAVKFKALCEGDL